MFVIYSLGRLLTGGLLVLYSVICNQLSMHWHWHGLFDIFIIIAYQNKNHTFNWLNTLHVTFTIPRYRLECWYRPVQKPCI